MTAQYKKILRFVIAYGLMIWLLPYVFGITWAASGLGTVLASFAGSTTTGLSGELVLKTPSGDVLTKEELQTLTTEERLNLLKGMVNQGNWFSSAAIGSLLLFLPLGFLAGLGSRVWTLAPVIVFASIWRGNPLAIRIVHSQLAAVQFIAIVILQIAAVWGAAWLGAKLNFGDGKAASKNKRITKPLSRPRPRVE